MFHKKLVGIISIAVGVGVLLTLFIPQNFWCFFVAVTFIAVGVMLVKDDKRCH